MTESKASDPIGAGLHASVRALAALVSASERDELFTALTKCLAAFGFPGARIREHVEGEVGTSTIAVVIDVEGEPRRVLEVDVESTDDVAGATAALEQCAASIAQRLLEDRQRAELRHAEEILRTIAEHVPGAVYLCRNDARYSMLYLNAAVLEVTGYAASDFLADRISFVDLYHEGDRDRITQEVDAAIASRRPFFVQYRINHQSGAVRWVEERGQAIFDATGHVVLLEGTVFDITERRRAEEEHEQLAAELRQTQRLESLGILAGGIAHDFNNMLTAMLGNAELALLGRSPEATADALGRIVEAARRAALLTRKMLDYSGTGTSEKRPLTLCGQVREILGILEPSVSKKVHLEVDVDGDALTVVADAAQLQQVVMNLVINAAEAIGESAGHVRIRVRPVELGAREARALLPAGKVAAGTFVCLEVQDDGAGMPEATLAKIFDPFFTTKFTGRGLGLAAVLGIVSGHGGGLHVESAVGKGTTFRVYLPVCREPAAATPAPRSVRDLTGSGVVLVVDDDVGVRDLARRSLEHFGYRVLEAENGRRAVEIFGEGASSIDVVLLDVAMPEMDGAETLAALRRLSPRVPVIVSSGFAESFVAPAGGQASRVSFLAKPYEPTQLAAKVRDVLGRSLT